MGIPHRWVVDDRPLLKSRLVWDDTALAEVKISGRGSQAVVSATSPAVGCWAVRGQISMGSERLAQPAVSKLSHRQRSISSKNVSTGLSEVGFRSLPLTLVSFRRRIGMEFIGWPKHQHASGTLRITVPMQVKVLRPAKSSSRRNGSQRKEPSQPTVHPHPTTCTRKSQIPS